MIASNADFTATATIPAMADIFRLPAHEPSMEARAAAAHPADLDLPGLLQTQRDYDALTRVFSVVVERLLDLTGGRAIEMSDEAIERARGTRAWRDESRDLVMITVL